MRSRRPLLLTLLLAALALVAMMPGCNAEQFGQLQAQAQQLQVQVDTAKAQLEAARAELKARDALVAAAKAKADDAAKAQQEAIALSRLATDTLAESKARAATQPADPVLIAKVDAAAKAVADAQTRADAATKAKEKAEADAKAKADEAATKQKTIDELAAALTTASSTLATFNTNLKAADPANGVGVAQAALSTAAPLIPPPYGQLVQIGGGLILGMVGMGVQAAKQRGIAKNLANSIQAAKNAGGGVIDFGDPQAVDVLSSMQTPATRKLVDQVQESHPDVPAPPAAQPLMAGVTLGAVSPAVA